jgi:murein DD-endopeptidase MepM/ murein hydrolase activator NlpD
MQLLKLSFILINAIVISNINLIAVDNNPNSTPDTTRINIDSVHLVADTVNTFEQQEDAFQDYLDTVFMGVDTIFWDNKMINSGRFDSKDMQDTINIVLKDSLKGLTYCHPFKNYVSCNFGPRRYIHHYGVDIKLHKGDTVRAAFEGIIRVTKYDRRGFGRVVVIRHPSGLETIYGHLSKVLVVPNQKVKAGEVIGLGGNSGRSTGAHLHFETRYRGEPFDPNCVIDFENCKLKSDTLQLSKANFEYLVELRKAKYCTIREGDSLGRIALRYHTSVTTLCKLNRIGRKTMIRAGRKLRYQ